MEESNLLITNFVTSNFNEVERKLWDETFKSYNEFETEVYHY